MNWLRCGWQNSFTEGVKLIDSIPCSLRLYESGDLFLLYPNELWIVKAFSPSTPLPVVAIIPCGSTDTKLRSISSLMPKRKYQLVNVLCEIYSPPPKAHQAAFKPAPLRTAHSLYLCSYIFLSYDLIKNSVVLFEVKVLSKQIMRQRLQVWSLLASVLESTSLWDKGNT